MAGSSAARQVAKARDMGTKPGWPDFEIIYQGRIYLIEVKSEKGRLDGSQPECHDDLRRAGALVGVARSIDDVAALMDEWGIIPMKKAA